MDATANMLSVRLTSTLCTGRQALRRWARAAGRKLLAGKRDLTGFASCAALVVGFGLIYLPLGFLSAGALGLTLLHLTAPADG